MEHKMHNFTFYNPVKIVFGKGMIAELPKLVPKEAQVLLTFGGGSIKKNGVYAQTMTALNGFQVYEFGGIEANPKYETLMKAVELAKKENINFLLSVGGGSVLDGTKFIAAAIPFQGDNPWDILSKHSRVKSAVPFGAILTLPATGSEMNAFAVISKFATQEKLAFASSKVFPLFSILDPDSTVTLDPRQTANGIIDAFAHVLEQYMTYPVHSPLQDRQAEAILLSLLQEGPKVMAHPQDYNSRANIMWCATQALNGLIGCGVVQDWATHIIGHELTALYGLDHAQSLAVVFPAMLRHQQRQKSAKLLQYAERIFAISTGAHQERIEKAIDLTEAFFHSLGVGVRLVDYGIPSQGLERISARISAREGKIGEHKDIGPAEIDEILQMCFKY
jgi:NADP-dependent alcohol dehydrogenase